MRSTPIALMTLASPAAVTRSTSALRSRRERRRRRAAPLLAQGRHQELRREPVSRSSGDESECVTEAEQRALTAAARRRWAREQARAWGTAATEIGRAIESFKSEGHPDRQLLRDVAAIERQVARTQRHVDAAASASS
jgi:gas vesicle protein